MENHLSISKAAKILGVSTETLRRWDKTGKFPSQRHPINNYRVYNEEKVNLLLKDVEQKYLFEARSSTQNRIFPVFETKSKQEPSEKFGCQEMYVEHLQDIRAKQ